MDRLYKYIRDYRILYMGICILFVVCAAFYHYGLLSIFPQNAEDIMSITSMYSHLKLGIGYQPVEYLYSLCAYLSTIFGGGVTYTSVRLLFALLYAVLMCCTLYLCLQQKGKSAILFLPLIAWLAVLLCPASYEPELFWDSGGRDLIYLWPFMYHYSSRILMLLCLVAVDKCANARKNKKLLLCITAVVIIYSVSHTDLIFLLTFVGPACIVLLLHSLYNKSMRKWMIGAVLAFMAVMLISKMIPGENMIRNYLWGSERAHVYGAIYGGTNWTSIDILGEHLLNYVELIFTMFNIQLASSPVISLYTVLSVLKLLVVCAGYVMIIHIIKSSIWRDGRHYDCVDEILAWAYLMLSLIFIFTDYGSSPFMRYFPSLTTIMTILLCRNLEYFPEIVKLSVIKEINHKKVLLGVCTLCICLCSAGKVWTYAAPDVYSGDMKAIAEYIQWSDYGYAIATSWVAPRVSAMGDGSLLVYTDMNKIKSTYGEDAKCTYIITRNFNNPAAREGFTVYRDCTSWEQICEYYSEPSDIICYDQLAVIVFEDGI